MSGRGIKHLRAAVAVQRFRNSDHGASLVEFAICGVLLILLIFATWESCMAVYTYTVIADAANEGVRYAMVHSSDQSGAIAKVKTYAAYSLHNISAIQVSVTYPDGSASPPNRVAVKVVYNYIPYVSSIFPSPKLTTYAEGTLLY